MNVNNVALGFYVAAIFISASEEEARNADGRRVMNHYLLVAIGGRKGAFNIKYDDSETAFSDFIADLSVGDEILCGVRYNVFNGVVYFSLTSIQWLRARKVSASPAVDKLVEKVSGGSK